jgi:hypothetical protein
MAAQSQFSVAYCLHACIVRRWRSGDLMNIKCRRVPGFSRAPAWCGEMAFLRVAPRLTHRSPDVKPPQPRGCCESSSPTLCIGGGGPPLVIADGRKVPDGRRRRLLMAFVQERRAVAPRGLAVAMGIGHAGRLGAPRRPTIRRRRREAVGCTGAPVRVSSTTPDRCPRTGRCSGRSAPGSSGLRGDPGTAHRRR